MEWEFKIVGAEKLQQKLKKETITGPLKEGIKKLALWAHRTVVISTPVDEGRLRSSTTTEVYGYSAKIGTNVEYARFVEYGHKQEPGRFVKVLGKRLVESWVPPSRVTEGTATRQRDMGPYTYMMKKMQGKIKDFLGEIGKAIEVKFG